MEPEPSFLLAALWLSTLQPPRQVHGLDVPRRSGLILAALVFLVACYGARDVIFSP
jgi:hypothetical protein